MNNDKKHEFYILIAVAAIALIGVLVIFMSKSTGEVVKSAKEQVYVLPLPECGDGECHTAEMLENNYCPEDCSGMTRTEPLIPGLPIQSGW